MVATTIRLLGVLSGTFAIFSARADVLLQDDFDDNSIDTSKWAVVTTNVPGSPNAVEQNMRMEFYGRPVLNTVSTFDPEAVGGLKITGRFEFVTGSDIFKILTRSDGIPIPNYGEVGNALQFVFSANGGVLSPSISPRGGAITISSYVGGVGINAVGGDAFDFEVIDDGADGLSFTVTKVGSPATTSTTTAVLATDTTTYDLLVTFHNRENGRTSYLDDVVISSLRSSAPFEITEFEYSPDTNEITITWRSIPGDVYRVEYSTDLSDWGSDFDDSVAADSGESTTRTFDLGDYDAENEPNLFVRVRKQ